MGNIKVRNNLKGPVLFRVPGRSVHLPPGGAVQLPGHFKDAAELKKLCLRQAVSLLEEKPEKIEPAPDAGEEVKEEKEKKKNKSVKGAAKKKSKPKEQEENKEKKEE